MEFKSVVISLALLHRFIDMDQAVAAARVDEEYNIDMWGLVEGGHDVDRANVSVQVATASTLLWLLEVGKK